MGLPGSGKTYLAERLKNIIQSAWFNADEIRKMANDWDFSDQGRLRQANRMKSLADFEKLNGRTVICDFVCPTKETRKNFNADILIWMDTIEKSVYDDTNKIFDVPNKVDFHITEWNDKNHKVIAASILKNV